MSNTYEVTMLVRKYNADGIFYPRPFTVDADTPMKAVYAAIDAAHADRHETSYHVCVYQRTESGLEKVKPKLEDWPSPSK